MSRLVVVSNRVATPRHARSGSQGGLAVAVQAALEERGGLWFGWSGEVDEQPKRKPDEFTSGPVSYVTSDLTPRDYEEYYNGFANRTLWPLMHYRLDLTEFSRRNYSGYERVNSLFADRLLPYLKSDDIVWVHDYHLIPMADQLRHAGCGQRMGFFLHIPWPALEVFLALPNHRDIVKQMCAYDMLGFQTERDLANFQHYIRVEAGGRVEPVARHPRQVPDITAGAGDIAEAGSACLPRRGVADGEHRQVPPRFHVHEPAHAVGAGEQQGLDVGQIDRFGSGIVDLEHWGNDGLVAAPGHGLGQPRRILGRAGDQPATHGQQLMASDS